MAREEKDVEIAEALKAYKNSLNLGKFTKVLLRESASALPRRLSTHIEKAPKLKVVKLKKWQVKARKRKTTKVVYKKRLLKKPETEIKKLKKIVIGRRTKIEKTPLKKPETEIKKLKKIVIGRRTKIEKTPKIEKIAPEDTSLKGLLKAYEKIGVTEKSTVQIEGFPMYDVAAHGPLAVFEGLSGYEEVDRYWVDEPFAFATILHDPKTNERVYYVVEPALTEAEKTLLGHVYEYLGRTLVYEGTPEDKDRFLAKKVAQAFKTFRVSITPQTAHKILYYIKRTYLGYGEINALMKDQNIEDISCNGLGIPIFLYHRRHYHIPTNIVFDDETRLNSFVTTLVERCGKMISFGKPTVDATLPDGSRLQATLGDEITTRGSSFTVRKFAKEPFTPIHLIKHRTYSHEMLAYLWLATENKKNVMVIGETASGKTSTLNALAQFIPPDAKIVSLEETRELTLYQRNWIPSVTREAVSGDMPITLYDLLRQALRQRPECIIVGEVRGREGLVLFQAMSTGHTCHSTMHASTVQEAVNRLEGDPINVPHSMLAALDILGFQSISYLGKERVRRTHTILEFTGLDPATGSIRINEVYKWNPTNDTFEKVGDSFVLREIMAARGWGPLELAKEIQNRVRILEYLDERDITDYDQVSLVMRQFYADPKRLMERIDTKKPKS